MTELYNGGGYPGNQFTILYTCLCTTIISLKLFKKHSWDFYFQWRWTNRDWIYSHLKQLKNWTKPRKHWFSDTGHQVAQRSLRDRKQVRWASPSPSLLRGEFPGHGAGRGNPGAALVRLSWEPHGRWSSPGTALEARELFRRAAEMSGFPKSPAEHDQACV